MALTGQVNPTSSPLNTTNEPSDPDGGGNTSSLASSGGSPALILVFLSISLFVVAITSTFGWRRFLRSRRGHEPTRPDHPHEPSKPPAFWDVYINNEVVDAFKWETITPMTATMTCPVPPITSLHDPDPGGRAWRLGRYQVVSAVKRTCWPGPAPLLEDEDTRDEVIPPILHMLDEGGDASSVVVSVLIAMPTRRCGLPEKVELGRGEVTRTRELCVGMAEVGRVERRRLLG